MLNTGCASIGLAPLQGDGNRAGARGVERLDRGAAVAENFQQGGDVLARGGFVHADADRIVVDAVQVVAGGDRRLHDLRRSAGADLYFKAVEEVAPRDAQGAGQQGGEAVDARGDGAQAERPVPHRIHAGDVGQQHLRGADVGIGLFAADVLLARLQRHAVGGLAARILRDADDAARHRAHVRLACGEEGGVRSAEAQRHAEALRGTERDVGAHFAGRFEQHQCHQIRGHGDHAALALDRGDARRQIDDFAARIGILQQGAEHVVTLRGVFRLAEYQFETEIRGAGPDHVDGLREGCLIDEKDIAPGLGNAPRHGHRFGGGRGLVEQRGVGDFQAGQVDHHLLVVEQGFEAALCDLGLVGRVGGVPAGILEQVAQDHGRRQRAVIALADQRLPDHVLCRDGFQCGQRRVFRHGAGQVERALQADGGGYRFADQRAQRIGADRGEHAGNGMFVGADVAADEFVAIFQLGERVGKVFGVHVRASRRRLRRRAARPVRSRRRRRRPA